MNISKQALYHSTLDRFKKNIFGGTRGITYSHLSQKLFFLSTFSKPMCSDTYHLPKIFLSPACTNDSANVNKRMLLMLAMSENVLT